MVFHLYHFFFNAFEIVVGFFGIEARNAFDFYFCQSHNIVLSNG